MKAALLHLTFLLPELELVDRAFAKGFNVVFYLNCNDGGGIDQFTALSWKDDLTSILIELGGPDAKGDKELILRGDRIEEIKKVFLKNVIAVEEFDVDDPESLRKFEAIPEAI